MFRMRLLSLGVALGYCFVPLWAGQVSEFHQFAHLGDGGGIRAVFLIGTDATDEVTVNLRFFKSDGSELSLRIGNQTGASLNFAVPAGGTLRLVTAGDSDPIQTGWAQVFATEPVRAQLLFEIRVDDKLVTQAAVDSSEAVRNASVFVDQRSDSNTGLAIANTSQSGPIRVILTLRAKTARPWRPKS